MRNLILDYSGLAEFQSSQINAGVVQETQRTNAQVQRQIFIIGVAALIAIGFLVSVVYFLQTRVVRRLYKLNRRVLFRLEGKDANIYVGGNDEISDIDRTFDLFAQTIEDQNHRLHELSLSDGLTGIANRRALDDKLLHEIRLAIRQRWHLSVLLIDVDFFKLYNDHYGHNNGDICLKHIAQTLKNNLPSAHRLCCTLWR